MTHKSLTTPSHGLGTPLAAQGRGAGEPHRSGKRVYYHLSCAGESLLGIFGELE